MTIKAQFPDEQSAEGAFTRQLDAFKDRITANGSSGYPAASGRYHLYVSLACPWAHRTIIVRKLKQLEAVVGMTVVDPIRDERGWAFRDGPGHSLDPINGFQFLSQAYKATDPDYRRRFTVPVLWDRVTKRIVTNSDDDLMRMFNGEFNRFTKSTIDLYQEGIRKEIDDLNNFIYENVNDGVYRAGFATSQQTYERAVLRLFNALDQLEDRLARQRYLFGAQFVDELAKLLALQSFQIGRGGDGVEQGCGRLIGQRPDLVVISFAAVYICIRTRLDSPAGVGNMTKGRDRHPSVSDITASGPRWCRPCRRLSRLPID